MCRVDGRQQRLVVDQTPLDLARLEGPIDASRTVPEVPERPLGVVLVGVHRQAPVQLDGVTDGHGLLDAARDGRDQRLGADVYGRRGRVVDGHRVRETHGHLEPIGRLRMQRILRQAATHGVRRVLRQEGNIPHIRRAVQPPGAPDET